MFDELVARQRRSVRVALWQAAAVFVGITSAIVAALLA